jgi:hypothetical protein
MSHTWRPARARLRPQILLTRRIFSDLRERGRRVAHVIRKVEAHPTPTCSSQLGVRARCVLRLRPRAVALRAICPHRVRSWAPQRFGPRAALQTRAAVGP